MFVISPRSIHFSVCSWEIEQVMTLKKRLAPVVLGRVPDDRIPAAVAKINYVFFDEPDEAEQQSGRAGSGAADQPTMVEEPHLLGGLAHRWNERGRAGALALRGQELEEADRWVASHQCAAPEPSELHKSFLAEGPCAGQAAVTLQGCRCARGRLWRSGWRRSRSCNSAAGAAPKL